MRVVISQLPMIKTASAMRRNRTSTRRRVRAFARARSASASAAMPATRLRGDAALRAFIADQDLVPEVVPDLAVQLDEPRQEADLGDVARPRQVYAVGALDGPGSGGDDDDAVCERDRLLEVVRHEDHRCAPRGPEIEQLVLHEHERLDVARDQ